MGSSKPINFKDLRNRFSHAENLPDLPTAAVRLCEMIDQGNATTALLERVILGDPALTAALLRQASSAHFGGKPRDIGTVRGAIMLLGERAIRSMAVSLWVHSLMTDAADKSSFDVKRYARHSAFVGFTARYLESCRQRQGTPSCEWSPDEIFAAGLLHDLGVGLLAVSLPELYDKLALEASMRNWTMERIFTSKANASLTALGAEAARAWNLPAVFSWVPEHFADPMAAEKEVPALCCLRYADFLANSNGYSLEEGELKLEPLDPKIISALGLPAEEFDGVVDLIASHVAAYTQVAA